MKLEIAISSEIPIIVGNLEDIEKTLIKELNKYDVLIDINSDEAVKEAKATATAINKLKGQIDTLRKNEVTKLSAPIKVFEEKMKSLANLCADSRTKINNQISIIDIKKKAKVKSHLAIELTNAYTKYGIKDEYKIVKFEDLIIASNLTKTSVVKKAKDAIDNRVIEVKAHQDKIENRILTLDTICLKGGLQNPLTRANINHILMEDSDDVYLEKLVILINNEIHRNDENVKREQQIKQRQEQQQTIVTPTEKPIVVVRQQVKSTQRPQQPTSQRNTQRQMKNAEFATPREAEPKTYRVTATFEVSYKGIGSNLIQILLKKFVKSGFKIIPTVTVKEVRKVA